MQNKKKEKLNKNSKIFANAGEDLSKVREFNDAHKPKATKQKL